MFPLGDSNESMIISGVTVPKRKYHATAPINSAEAVIETTIQRLKGRDFFSAIVSTSVVWGAILDPEAI